MKKKKLALALVVCLILASILALLKGSGADVATTCGLSGDGTPFDWTGSYTDVDEDISSPNITDTIFLKPGVDGAQFRLQLATLTNPQRINKIVVQVHVLLIAPVPPSPVIVTRYTLSYLVDDVEVASWVVENDDIVDGYHTYTHTATGLDYSVASDSVHELEFTAVVQGGTPSIDVATVYPCVTYESEKEILGDACTERSMVTVACTEKVIDQTP